MCFCILSNKNEVFPMGFLIMGRKLLLQVHNTSTCAYVLGCWCV